MNHMQELIAGKKAGKECVDVKQKIFEEEIAAGNYVPSPRETEGALALYLVFMIMPIIDTVYISLHEWNGASPTMKFIGSDNYTRIFSDSIFYKAIGNNVIWITTTITFPVFIGLLLALMVTQKHVKGVVFFRVTFFIPAVASLVAVGVVWSWIYNPEFGAVNKLLNYIAGGKITIIDWLGDGRIAIWSLLIAGSCTYYGFCMVVFIAALQGIDKSFWEVAVIEGASAWQKFRHITIPVLKGTITLVVVYFLIGSFKVFDLVYIMTKGGPYHSSEAISTYMFISAFRKNEYGAALAVVLTGIVVVCCSCGSPR